jgi:hypothetical protein
MSDLDDLNQQIDEMIKQLEVKKKKSPNPTASSVAKPDAKLPSLTPGTKAPEKRWTKTAPIEIYRNDYKSYKDLPPIGEGSPGERVVKAARIICGQPGIQAAFCWDFCLKVYNYAGCTVSRVYQDLNYVGKDCGTHHAGPELIAQIKPGDWLYINNKNNSDEHGCHSVIVLLINGTNIEAASAPMIKGSGVGVINNINLLNNPVTHISHPVDGKIKLPATYKYDT